VHARTPAGTKPAIAKAAFCVPAPAKQPLAEIIMPVVDQDDPLYFSVHAHPPKK
jgi:hypothetical protein